MEKSLDKRVAGREEICPECGCTYLAKGPAKMCRLCRIEKRKEYQRQYQHKYLEDAENLRKHRVRCATDRMLSRGELELQKRCAKCGSKDGLELHHTSYEAEFCEIAVVTLCKSCHEKLHSKKQKGE